MHTLANSYAEPGGDDHADGDGDGVANSGPNMHADGDVCALPHADSQRNRHCDSHMRSPAIATDLPAWRGRRVRGSTMLDRLRVWDGYPDSDAHEHMHAGSQSSTRL